MKKLLGNLVAVALGLFGQAAVAHADDQQSEEEAWAQLNAQINADYEAGRLEPDKGQTGPLEKHEVIEPEGGGGGNNGTGTRKGYIGMYPERSGVILVTPDFASGIVPSGHAGIVYNKDVAVESIDKGVTRMPNTWYVDKTQAIGVTVLSTTEAQDAAAAEWAHAQIGKPYNINFWNVNRRDRFYCAQLVWAAFKDKYGINLDTYRFKQAIHPMELVLTPKTKTIYKMRP